MKKVIKVLFVCHGNICRSTMAQSYFTWLADRRGLSYNFEIDSAATSREEIGNPPHPGTVSELKKHKIPVINHKARRMTSSDAEYYDLLVGMDRENMWGMRRITGGRHDKKMFMLMEFKPDGSTGGDKEVDDPWYSGDFESTYRDIEKGCAGLLEYCKKKFGI